MKKLLILLAAGIFGSPVFAQDPLQVMTFNIRLNTASDSLNAWPYRKDLATSQVLYHQVSILGVQEALHGQMMDLQERLKGYRYTGVGRDDGREKGEYSAIFYDTSRVRLLSGETFWLSETPAVPGSKSWDAAITRIVTWGKFQDKKTRKTFFVFNTHFDHIGKQARAHSAELILEKVKELAGNLPVIVMGDFNTKPSDEPYQIITRTSNPLHLTDTKSISKRPHYGPEGTFTGFGPKETDNEPIDHIFVRKDITVLSHATLSQTWGGRYSSDHFPVLATVLIK